MDHGIANNSALQGEANPNQNETTQTLQLQNPTQDLLTRDLAGNSSFTTAIFEAATMEMRISVKVAKVTIGISPISKAVSAILRLQYDK